MHNLTAIHSLGGSLCVLHFILAHVDLNRKHLPLLLIKMQSISYNSEKSSWKQHFDRWHRVHQVRSNAPTVCIYIYMYSIFRCLCECWKNVLTLMKEARDLFFSFLNNSFTKKNYTKKISDCRQSVVMNFIGISHTQ